MFSLIQSLWTEDMAKKFVPRKGYSQDSEELPCTSQSGTIRMPGFCYKLTMSGEEGFVKPVATISAAEDKSPLYCDPLIVTLKDIPELTQPLRITMFVQVIYRIQSDTSKLQDVFYCRDASVSGFVSIIMRGTHSEVRTNKGEVYCFKDVLVESDQLYVDGYSRILSLHSLPDTLHSKAPSIDDIKVLKKHDLLGSEKSSLQEHIKNFLCTSSGSVRGVDEETACSWLTCPKCDSDKLSGGTTQNPFLYCDVCEIGVNKPVTRMHLEVFLTDTAWEGKATVKVQLLQRTTQKLLPNTMDDDGYEMSSVLNKHIGPITCVLLKSNVTKDGGKLMHLEEISFVS